MSTLSHHNSTFVEGLLGLLSQLRRGARDWLDTVKQSRRARAAAYLHHQALRQLDHATLRDLGLAERLPVRGTEDGLHDHRARWS